jgi:hypothetical protein
MTQAQLLAMLDAMDGWETEMLSGMIDHLFFAFLKHEGYSEVVTAYQRALRRVGKQAHARDVYGETP